MFFTKDRTGRYATINDRTLRDKSFIYGDNVKKGLPKFASHANIQLTPGIKLIDVYVVNNA
jgi:hypothetical protein